MPQCSASQARLRRLFTEGFTAMDVARPLPLFDEAQNVEDVLGALDDPDLEAVGVLRRGTLAGFAEPAALEEGNLGEYIRAFDTRSILTETAPLAQVVGAIDEAGYCFVRVLERPTGLVTRADLEKAPVRMWLFGMITLVEMAITQAVRNYFPGERWMSVLPEGRLQKALELWRERQRRRQNVDPLDCIQLADKIFILVKDPDVRKELEFESRRKAEQRFQRIQSLRNNLAHAQDIVTYDWDAIVLVAKHIDLVLDLMRDERFRPHPDRSGD